MSNECWAKRCDFACNYFRIHKNSPKGVGYCDDIGNTVLKGAVCIANDIVIDLEENNE